MFTYLGPEKSPSKQNRISGQLCFYHGCTERSCGQYVEISVCVLSPQRFTSSMRPLRWMRLRKPTYKIRQIMEGLIELNWAKKVDDSKKKRAPKMKIAPKMKKTPKIKMKIFCAISYPSKGYHIQPGYKLRCGIITYHDSSGKIIFKCNVTTFKLEFYFKIQNIFFHVRKLILVSGRWSGPMLLLSLRPKLNNYWLYWTTEAAYPPVYAVCCGIPW